ncbi:SDR family NAD(P)-dependent oxidoreductase [Paenibacillus plantarum]|uniref:SDR family NAD(P)-dependent oxidoreductase n=1 Tax=Paenibacillus plantarum TaxID=2654975 RepID=UPI001492D01A|nr:SDR family NAD(P)-dependent oxidoreductase [Paenibacillus plantarum]
MQALEGKVILVTGALGKIGRASVKCFLDEGAVVAFCDQLELELFPDMFQLSKEYGPSRLLFIQSDANDEAQVIQLIESIRSSFGRLDGLLHTVYTQVQKAALDLSLEEWNHVLLGSLTSTFLVNKYSIQLMIQHGGGAIVNTSSVLGETGAVANLAYGTAKAGMNQFTKLIAFDYADQGIRANVIAPGDIKTIEQIAAMTEEQLGAIRKLTLLKRSGTPEEVAKLSAFLLSDASSYITGTKITIDGGYKL